MAAHVVRVRSTYVAALLAVALLLFAGVRSSVMQAEMAASPQSGTAMCMDMGGGRGAPSKPEKPAKAWGPAPGSFTSAAAAQGRARLEPP